VINVDRLALATPSGRLPAKNRSNPSSTNCSSDSQSHALADPRIAGDGSQGRPHA